MEVISEENWSHVLFEHDNDWILTVLISEGAATYDRCIKLVEMEKKQVRENPAYVKVLVDKVRSGSEKGRYVLPPIWPQHYT